MMETATSDRKPGWPGHRESVIQGKCEIGRPGCIFYPTSVYFVGMGALGNNKKAKYISVCHNCMKVDWDGTKQ